MSDEPTELEASGRAAEESFSEEPLGAEPRPCPSSEPTREPSDSWIEVSLIGEDDQPVVGERYRIELPDGSAIEGTIGASGVVRLEGIDPETCRVSFPELDASAWERV